MVPFYFLGDLLFSSSRREGVGVPALEGSLFRLPAAFSDIPPLKEIGQHFKSHLFFRLDEPPEKIAARVDKLLADSSVIQDRRTVIEKYGWAAVFTKKIRPLLEK